MTLLELYTDLFGDYVLINKPNSDSIEGRGPAAGVVISEWGGVA